MKRFLAAFLIFLMATPALAQMPLSSATVYASPDVRSWPVTATISRLELLPSGVHIEFTKKDGSDRWPDVTPPGWTGTIQYTLWLVLNTGGSLSTSGIIEFWHGLEASGGDVTADNQIARNWVYDSRWGPMQGHQPAPGEHVGFFVTAGDARGRDIHAVAERSNVVEIVFPATSGAVFPPFAWVEGAVAPPPPPVPTPAPPVVVYMPAPPAPPAPIPATPLPVTVDSCHAEIAALAASVEAGRVENRSFFAAVGAEWKRIAAIAVPIVGALAAGLKLGKP